MSSFKGDEIIHKKEESFATEWNSVYKCVPFALPDANVW